VPDTPNAFNQQVIDEFRARNGRVGGMFAHARLLLLTTTGARTGRPHTTPLGYLPDGDRVLVIASAGGAPRHPQWFRNVLARPRVTVEDGVLTYEADAAVLAGEERDRMFARAAEAEPGWAAYQERAGRALPVVALTGVPGPPRFAADSPGAALRLVHDAFRRELALIRREITEAGPGARPGLGAQLRVNCLTLCGGLRHHHTLEDTGMFPALARQRPDLADVLAELGRQHEEIAALVEELHAVVTAADAGPAGVLAEVDRLIATLHAHLDAEEAALVPVLDG
jgi:deazaflavin-dependent oxidoreductase (nitroreductase family)